MNKETLRMQLLSGVITESEYKAKLTENKPSSKETLKENFVGMGMVGNIFDREKTDYELAFEHFTKGTSLNEDIYEEELEEIGVGAVLGAAAIATLAKKAYDKYKNYASRKGMEETGNEKKGSNGIVAKEYKLKDGSTYWGITFEDKTRDQGYTDPRILLFSPNNIEKVLNTDLKADESDEARMGDNYTKKLGQFTADKVIMLEGEELEENIFQGEDVMPKFRAGALKQLIAYAEKEGSSKESIDDLKAALAKIEAAYQFVYDKKVLPSMRSLQFAGKPIQINNARLYNCCFLPINHTDAFSEVKYRLIIPQEEPKQESLEEAAERAVKSGLFKDKTLFIAGAKWQAERMYSEEEVKLAYNEGQVSIISANYIRTEKWFEQFKKK